MNLDELAQRIQDMYQCAAQLQQHAEESPSQQQQLKIMATAFQELNTTLEELQVANEKLYASHQELSAAYQVVVAERQRYQELFEFAPEAYLLTDTNGVIQEANRAAATLLNISQTFLVGKPLDIYVVNNERSAFHSKLSELFQGDRLQEWEMCLQPCAQTSITTAVRVAAFPNQENQLVCLRWLVRDITECKQAQKAQTDTLVESQPQLQIIMDNSPAAVYLKDRHCRYLMVNQQYENNLRLSKDQIIGRTDYDFMPQAAADQFVADDQEVLANPTLLVLEDEMQLEDGLHTYITIKFPLFDAKTVPYAVCSISTDITERKRTEESLHKLNQELENRVRERTTELEQLNELLIVEIALRARAEASLRQREQEFRALVENAPDVIERFDQELRYVYVNPVVEKVRGKLPREFIGKTCRELGMSEPNLSLWEGVLRKIFETGHEEQIDFSVVTPDGLRYYQTRLVPEFGADTDCSTGRRPVSILGISRDITDHKLALEALRESEQRFRQLADNIQDVFWITSPGNTQVIYVSPGYEKIWGRTCESVHEQPLFWLEAVHPEDRDRVKASITNLMQGAHEREYRIVRSDGSIRWIRDRGFPVLDEQGIVYRIAGIAEDITYHKHAELETYKMLQRERELGELKSRFISMTSHEFRTPLTTIQSSSEILERYHQQLSQEKQLTHLHRIQKAVERMTQMLDDILLIGKTESGKLEFQPIRIDLVQLCRELIEELQHGTLRAHYCEQVITFTSHCPCFPTNVDEKLLRHILSNLLSNAIKYSPGSRCVQFDLTCLDSKAVFTIQDQGIGIPPEDLPHLFEAFHRATNVGTIQGTGLGLAIVKQCVELHQGEITVKSEVGKGTTFTVTLPLSNSTLRA